MLKRVVTAPTCSVSANACSHSSEAASFAYHRSDRPGGGKRRYVAELKEIVSTTMTGNSR